MGTTRSRRLLMVMTLILCMTYFGIYTSTDARYKKDNESQILYLGREILIFLFLLLLPFPNPVLFHMYLHAIYIHMCTDIWMCVYIYIHIYTFMWGLEDRLSLCSSDWPWTYMRVSPCLVWSSVLFCFLKIFRIFQVNSALQILMNLIAKAILDSMRYSKVHKRDAGFQGNWLLSTH